MRTARDFTDLIGGALLAGGGAWFMLHAGNYPMGTLQRMGPAYFPFAIGVLVLIFGLAILVPALFRAGELPMPEWRPFVAITLSVLTFAVVVERFGLVPATVALTVAAAAADEGFRPVHTAILAAALSVIAVVVFTMGLGIPVPAFRWFR